MPLRVGLPYQPYSFLIKKLDGLIVAQDDRGRIRFSGINATTVIQSAIDALTKGGIIYVAKELNPVIGLTIPQNVRIIYEKAESLKRPLTTQTKRGLLSITFDDGKLSQYENALKILEAYRVKATFFVFTDGIGTSGFMTTDQLKEVAKLGHEVASHGKAHVDETTLTEAELDTQLDKSPYFEANGFEVYTHSYPHGAYNSTVIKKVKESGYYAALEVGNTRNTLTEILRDTYHLDRFLCAWDGGAPALNNLNEVKTEIDNAVTNNDWVVLLFHDIPHPGGFPTEDDLREIIEYALEKGIQIKTVRDVVLSRRSVYLNTMDFVAGSPPPARGFVGDFPTWDFDEALDERIHTSFAIPEDYLFGTPILFRWYWVMATAISGSVRFVLYWLPRRLGEDVTATPSGMGGTIAVPSVAGELAVNEWLLTGFDLDEEVASIEFWRQGTHAADTATGDLRLLGVEIVYLSTKVKE